MKKNLLVIVIIIILVGAGAFWGGIKYQQNKRPSRIDFRTAGEIRPGARFQGPEGFQTVRGEIISQDEKSITVKLPDSSSRIIMISENTKIIKATEASTDDLKTGEQVMVSGQTNSDGSLSASQVQLNFGLGRDI